MRHTLFSIYNKVALDIGDPKFEKITKQEYITVAGEIALEISMKSRMFVSAKVFTAVGGEDTIIVHSHHAVFFDILQAQAIWDSAMIGAVSSRHLKSDDIINETFEAYPGINNLFVNGNYDLYSLIYNLKALVPMMCSGKFVNFDMFKPLYINRVIRNSHKCEEMSETAIAIASGRRTPFNNNYIPNRYDFAVRKLNGDSHYYGDKTVDYIVTNNTEDSSSISTAKLRLSENEVSSLSESMILHFPVKFEPGEQVSIEFSVQMPIHSELHELADNNYTAPVASYPSGVDDDSAPHYRSILSTPQWVEFEDNTVIPDVLEVAFYKGIRRGIIEKLSMKDFRSWSNQYVLADKIYREELNKLASYQRNKKDLSSTVVIQPFAFLSEGI